MIRNQHRVGFASLALLLLAGAASADPAVLDKTVTGTIKGNTMTLTLKVGDSEEETFTLEKGKPGELVKCK